MIPARSIRYPPVPNPQIISTFPDMAPSDKEIVSDPEIGFCDKEENKVVISFDPISSETIDGIMLPRLKMIMRRMINGMIKDIPLQRYVRPRTLLF